MCLVVKENDKPGISKHDITVYKLGYPKTLFSIASYGLGEDNFIPIYKMAFIYIKDVLYPQVKLVLKENPSTGTGFIIEEGYHSFITIDESILAYARRMSRHTGFKVRFGKFTIPANTPYYLNGNEIVSETIIYKGLL